MKVRNGFVSNSSSSSFVIESKFVDSMHPDGREMTFKEYCDEYLLENMIDWGLDEDIRKVKICSDEEFIYRFINWNGSFYRVPECAKEEFERFKRADKTYLFNRKEYQEARDKLINKVYELLKPQFDNLKLYSFSASDHDHEYAGEDLDTNDEEFFREFIYNINGFTKIFNRH